MEKTIYLCSEERSKEKAICPCSEGDSTEFAFAPQDMEIV